MNRRRALLVAPGLLALASCTGPASTPSHRGLDPQAPPPGVTFGPPLDAGAVVAAETVYVPIYSSVATADNGRPLNLAATLVVRNLDQARPIEVAAVRYQDSGGRPVRALIDRPLQLAPLATVRLFVRESDETGGPTPSFLVDWRAGADVPSPLVEAIMISTASAQGITLTSTGRAIATRRPPPSPR